MERRPELREERPLRQRFEVIDRLACLDLDDDLQFVAALRRHQEQIGIQRRRSGSDCRVLLVPRVHGSFVTTAKLRV